MSNASKESFLCRTLITPSSQKNGLLVADLDSPVVDKRQAAFAA